MIRAYERRIIMTSAWLVVLIGLNPPFAPWPLTALTMLACALAGAYIMHNVGMRSAARLLAEQLEAGAP